MERRISSPKRLRGVINVPTDKSISHRAAILNAIASGPAVVDGFLPGADCLATVDCLRALGVSISVENVGSAVRLKIDGKGLDGLRESADVLDARNSGTTMRLLAGLLAGRPFLSILTGDESLRTRPMARVVQPLHEMGAQVWGRAKNTRLGRVEGTLAPLAIYGRQLRGIHYRSHVASAQVKSAVLLAALQADGETIFEEPSRSRDHTERMLLAMGADLREEDNGLRIAPLSRDLTPLSLRIPGDFSAAAFWLVAATLHPDAELHLRGVGMNQTRTGLLDVLRAMGADIEIGEERVQGGEPVADLTVRSARLRGTVVEGPLVVRLIDEVPVLAVAASLAEGKTVLRDIAELRVKESDRVGTTAQELRRLGARVEEQADALVIEGVPHLTGAACDSHGDHRLGMALAIAGLLARGETVVGGAEATDVSYPAFWDDIERLSTA